MLCCIDLPHSLARAQVRVKPAFNNMNPSNGNPSNLRQAVLGLLAMLLVPALVEAAGIGFRNDTPYPIYVQGSFIANGQIQRGPLILIKPGQTGWDVNLLKGNRTITIYNPSNQKLYQDIRVFQGKDQFYSVAPVPVLRGQPPRVDLKEMPLPPAK
jgi:hypothetical protein